ncbi:MAG: RNA polymerase sigma factor [Cyanothece sp. SIO1E1]|nr:RNA polymerase sigma factor [Cyanothece sp. SIO1E1]
MPAHDIDLCRWFETEVKPHEIALRGYLHNRVPESADVEDVIQEAYRRILSIRRRKSIDSAKGLLFTVARNVARDLFRRQSVANTIAVPEIDFYPVLDNVDEPDAALNRHEKVELLREAISRLPTRCRMVLILRNYEHLSYKEIAARMNISEGTVETQLKRALKKCKAFFDSRGLFE